MTQDTAALGIGDLARLAGVPVRTVRFYCDEGILESQRSVGGHRRFGAVAVDRLNLVVRLRHLGLGLPAISDVIAGRRSVAEAVTAERAALDVSLAELAWRRASLCAVEQASPSERAARLELLAVVQDGNAAYDTLVAFWRRQFLAPLPAGMFSMFIEVGVPAPPLDPTPRQVVAYAEMVSLATDRSLTQRLVARARQNRLRDEGTLLVGTGEACHLAEPFVLAGKQPGPGRALDRFVEVHALVRGRRDTPQFRRELLVDVAEERDPGIVRYWNLVGEVKNEVAPLGAIQFWLHDALDRAVRNMFDDPVDTGLDSRIR